MTKKRVSIHDVAEQLNVSISTVSRALNGQPTISEATVRRVQDMAQAMGYQANRFAVNLRQGRSKVLGVIVPHLNNNFFSRVLTGIEKVAEQAGYHVLICQSHEDAKQERDNLDALVKAQVDGILISLALATRDACHFEKIAKQETPLVFFDRCLENYNGHAVVVDDRIVSYRATKHLLEQGYRRIAHFTGPQEISIYKHRRQGYEDALHEYGIPFDAELLHVGNLKIADGIQGMQQLLTLSQPPDAIFAASDFAAVGILNVLKENGLRVPDDVALVGFSNELFARLMEPMLSSIDQQGEEMGKVATRLLLHLIQEQPKLIAPYRTVIRSGLMVRDSSRRCLVRK